MVDVEGKAIMGGPRPRANWWHMRPKEVWDRSVRDRMATLLEIMLPTVLEMNSGVGNLLPSRPEKCIVV